MLDDSHSRLVLEDKNSEHIWIRLTVRKITGVFKIDPIIVILVFVVGKSLIYTNVFWYWKTNGFSFFPHLHCFYFSIFVCPDGALEKIVPHSTNLHCKIRSIFNDNWARNIL